MAITLARNDITSHKPINLHLFKEFLMSVIVINDLILPNGVAVDTTKTAVRFQKGNKKAYLKGSNLEITNPLKELGKRVKRYSTEIIESCHLGNVEACIPGISDTVDLQKIINRYFKSR
jgi:hypothetical protein